MQRAAVSVLPARDAALGFRRLLIRFSALADPASPTRRNPAQPGAQPVVNTIESTHAATVISAVASHRSTS
ncbi:hypothetical protein AB0D14_17210 [Streptomyces sp. NPDC048484]|uniref:hypothetical protein n=1 Tax=Streptomyces sp. NPDC048484 TaxID=3155146 RepID=UPI00341339BD